MPVGAGSSDNDGVGVGRNDGWYLDADDSIVEPPKLIWPNGDSGAIDGNIGNGALPTATVTAGSWTKDELRQFEIDQRNANVPTTGSEVLDEGLQRIGGTVLGVASIVHGGAQFASDQFWGLSNVLSGGWLAQNNSAVQAAVVRNTELSQSLVKLPGQVSGLALRTMTGNWDGLSQGASNALNLGQISALNARGDYLGAQVLTTQSAINVAGGVAASGWGLARSGVLSRGGNVAMEASSIGSNPTIASNPATGNPAAIARGMGELSSRQTAVLNRLPEFGSNTIVHKSFSQTDLSALTAATGDEFAMFSTGGRRLIYRGDATSVPITPNIAQNLGEQGWRWSSHVHPGYDVGVLRHLVIHKSPCA